MMVSVQLESKLTSGFSALTPRELLSPSPEEGVEALGHDARGSRAAVGVGMNAGPALCVGHGRSPCGKSEDLTMPFPVPHPTRPDCQ